MILHLAFLDVQPRDDTAALPEFGVTDYGGGRTGGNLGSFRKQWRPCRQVENSGRGSGSARHPQGHGLHLYLGFVNSEGFHTWVRYNNP